MGVNSQVVSAEHELDWSQSIVQAGSGEPAKQPSSRRLQQQSEPLNCPRCDSTNTKFCYYNNYNKSQPRHFCKACKRHWTQGGTLRNVPVGGGRKNKRQKPSSSATKPSSTAANTSHQQDSHYIPYTASDQKTIPASLYEPFLQSSSPLLHDTIHGYSLIGSLTSGLNMNINLNENNADFSLSNLSTGFGMSSSLMPTSLNGDLYTGKFDSGEESTITTSVPATSSAMDMPWLGQETSSSMEAPSYWDWNNVGMLTSSNDYFDITWDDAEIKP